MELTKDFKKIVLEAPGLIDVRAPIEYAKGAFPNSVNLPIMTEQERHVVGIKYKEAGNEKATELGYNLVSGDIKESRVEAWKAYIQANPDALLYCFRGGSRSRISQEWLKEIGIDITRLEGGYKAFRSYLLEHIQNPNFSATPITLGGHTGSGKTKVIYQLKNAIDLEGIAHHRGSSFGHYIDDQPQQIDFENRLAYDLIQFEEKGLKHLVIEDESRNIGKCFIDRSLLSYFRSGKMVILEVPFEERVFNTLKEYVIDSQKDYIDRFGHNDGMKAWFTYIANSMERVKKRLGGDRFNEVYEVFNKNYLTQLSSGKYASHSEWIGKFLKEYYDPMYEYQMEKSTRDIAFKGNAEEMVAYLNSLD